MQNFFLAIQVPWFLERGNNNLVGLGETGSGLGIVVGDYSYFPDAVRFYHDIYGTYDMEVYQTGRNEIKMYNRRENTTYYLKYIKSCVL